MDLREIRSLVITALFSDDVLYDKLVLKGGNALDIIYNIGSRSSVDIDLSISEDFDDLDDAKLRIIESLRNRFDVAGYVLFDEEFEKRPSAMRPDQGPKWGGYQVRFKIISKADFDAYKGNLENLRRRSETVGPAQQRKFKIDISKFEFCSQKLETELDDQTIYVYSLSMIALEKLRAICQQMPAYEHRSYPRPRARDFLDIHTIANSGLVRIVSAENVDLLKRIFDAKEVPLDLLNRIEDFREFHRPDWEAVRQTTSDDLEEFDFYFDFVLRLINELQAVGIE